MGWRTRTTTSSEILGCAGCGQGGGDSPVVLLALVSLPARRFPVTAQLSRDEPSHPRPEHTLGREMFCTGICLKKHLLSPGASQHVENQTARGWWLHQVHLKKWDLASSQLGKEAWKEKAMCELAGDAPCLCEGDLMELRMEMQ